MTEATLKKPSPPAAEFIGRARAFRAVVDAEHERRNALIESIVAPLQARIRGKKPGFRQDSLITAARRWQREVPPAGRLALTIDLRDGELHVRELRADAGKLQHAEWAQGEREPDLGIVETKLTATPGNFGWSYTVLASVGLHACARRFERSRDQSHDGMRADLLAIAMAHPRLIDDPAIIFSIDAGDGRWVGRTMLTTLVSGLDDGKEQPTLGVRSFLV